jgi:F-type H+-transporting ATPase subunit alpha
VCIIYAVTKGYLNQLDVEKIPEFETRMQEFMESGSYYSVLEAIRATGKLESETEAQLQTALTELLKEFNP